MENKIYLVILNITSYTGIDAEHVYGNLILSDKKNVNIDNIEEYNVRYLGKNIEVKRPMTRELARQLDKKDGYGLNQRRLINFENNPDNPDYTDCGLTNRFDTIDQVVNAGIKKYKELNIECPFISLYEGNKYKNTFIINPN